MNNEAFQKMVRGRGGSSTKEIARAAVEDEFKKRRKGKKRSHDEYLSDSDDEAARKPKKQEFHFRPSQLKVTRKESEDDKQYRDRARERREGGATAGSNELAADPRATLPVDIKGLDLSLVRKERIQLKGQGDDINTPSSADEIGAASGLPSFELAQAALERFVANPVQSIPADLSEFVTHLVRAKFSLPRPTKRVTCGAEGRTLQRALLVLNPHTHLLDRTRAWEAPGELIQASSEYFPITPPPPETVMTYVSRLFPDSLKELHEASPPTVRTPFGGSYGVSSADVSGQGGQASSSKSPLAVTADDEDDDIFGGLDDYVPPKSS
jgi:hypothetical protein